MYIKLIYILIEKKVFNQFLLTFTEYFMNFIKIIIIFQIFIPKVISTKFGKTCPNKKTSCINLIQN